MLAEITAVGDPALIVAIGKLCDPTYAQADGHKKRNSGDGHILLDNRVVYKIDADKDEVHVKWFLG